MRVEADFLEDVRTELLAQLDAGGWPLPSTWPRKSVKGAPPARPFDSASVQDVAFLYFNVRRRLVPPAVRRVHWSQLMRGSSEAQEPAAAAAIAEIVRRSQVGDSLTPFLHRPIAEKPEFNDGLLNHWGMHHFHVGALVLDSEGFMGRSANVLCALVRPADIYFVKLHPHRQWSDPELLEIAHREWPHLLERGRLPFLPAPRGAPPVTAAEIHEARAAGVMAIVHTADGTAYAGIGGGISTSGLSIGAVSDADRLLDRAQWLERDARRRPLEIAQAIAKGSGRFVGELHLNLLLLSSGLEIIETQSRVRWKVA